MLRAAGAAVAHRELDDALDGEVLEIAAGRDAGESAAARHLGGGERLGRVAQRGADVGERRRVEALRQRALGRAAQGADERVDLGLVGLGRAGDVGAVAGVALQLVRER